MALEWLQARTHEGGKLWRNGRTGSNGCGSCKVAALAGDTGISCMADLTLFQLVKFDLVIV